MITTYKRITARIILYIITIISYPAVSFVLTALFIPISTDRYMTGEAFVTGVCIVSVVNILLSKMFWSDSFIKAVIINIILILLFCIMKIYDLNLFEFWTFLNGFLIF